MLMKYPKVNRVTCQCCNKKYNINVDDLDVFSICPYCEWEQDPFIKADTSYSSVNDTSLENYRKGINNDTNFQ